MKDVLFITHRAPYPPDRGDRIRAYQILRFLSARARVWLACAADEPLDNVHREHLESLCQAFSMHRISRTSRMVGAATRLAIQRSATEGAFFSRSLQRTIADWSKKIHFDGAVVYCSSMGQYLKCIRPRPARIVLDLVDLDSQKWRDFSKSGQGIKRWFYRLEARKVHALERRLASAADSLTLISDHEVDLFKRCHSDCSADVLSNGVDTDYFCPSVIQPESFAPRHAGEPQMAFIGVLNYRPNTEGVLWFAKHLWPLIRQRWPNANFDIVGRSPTDEIQSLNTIPGICVIGPVDDVRPYLRSADFSVAPLKIARGLQNKVLESLACSRPVIATTQAATGIDSNPGLFVADTEVEWLSAIETLWSDRNLLQQCGSQGREYVQQHYSWQARLKPLEALLGI